MQFIKRGRRHALGLTASLLLTASAWSQSPKPTIQLMSTAPQPSSAATKDLAQPAATPLAHVLRWAEITRQRADKIDDYACTFIKRRAHRRRT